MPCTKETIRMKAPLKTVGMLAVLLLVATAIFTHGSKVNAAGDSSITGTIKLDGTPPHQKPIDMSKEPSCPQLHASHPVTTENVVVGPNGGLANVVLYISDGLSGAAASQIPSQPQEINQKGCQ